MTDILVIGAGPAGLTAALYARRGEKEVTVVEKGAFGGQMTFSPRIENYPGFESVSGTELADAMVGQVLAQGASLEPDEIKSIEKTDGGFRAVGEFGSYEAKTVIIAAGAKHRQLGVEGENRFTGEGISYCAVCDGAFYKGKRVAVIGGGNSALQEAVLLSEGCAKVTLVQNLDYFTGEQKLVDTLKTKPNVDFITGTVVTEFLGETDLTGIRISGKDGERVLEVDGVFVAIGLVPQNGFASGLVSLDKWGYVPSGENTLTDCEGVFVAGDCRSKGIRQIATAVADGATAALAAIRYIDGM
ncbi:MAG: FAD-dependent oxidoreductase [Clostridia bacterium]|nr:FAD-dependent oxidoreductase [Clostridia bacterium]